MEISVNLKPGHARGLHQGQVQTPEIKELMQATDELGLNLRAKHPGIVDPRLSTQFSAQVDDPDEVRHVLERLKACRAVDAAYYVPAAELP